jgi:histidyl-tRNA synthetase
LRPEGTAPVVRAVLEHGLDRGPLPVKLSYASAMFRQERPQKGRYRQFFQLGIEAIGSDSPLVDAEVVEVGWRFLRDEGVEPRLLLNSIGHFDGSCRLGYLDTLRTWLEQNADALAKEDRSRVTTNPLRTFDSKEPETVEAMRSAPVITDHLCDSCRKHFESVRALLNDAGVPFDVDPTLVRGLDYYTRTAFEFVAGGLGSQNAVGGGGRYDGLSESLGGPPLPGIGFALGLDRIVLAQAEAGPSQGPVEVYVVSLGDEAARAAFGIVTDLRSAGIGAEMDLVGRGMKGQMKGADRSGARFAVIMGDEELAAGEATLRDMTSGDQKRVPFGEILESVRT